MALTQSHYRFGIVEGTESSHSWLAGEDREIVRLPGADGQFLLRVCVQETAGVAENNTALTWQYQRNGGGWNDITTTSAVARTGSNSVFTNGANCTKRLSGTGTFEASGAGCTHDGTSGGAANDIVANGNSETEIGLQIIAADTVVGDLIEFRVAEGATPLTAYDQIPRLRVATEILAIQSRDNSLHTSLSAGMSKISNTLVAVEAIGMSASDLTDATLTMEMNVWGTTVVGSTDPADYTQRMYGPDVWRGGVTGKDGLPVEPGFAWSATQVEGIRRVLATFQPSKTVTFGAAATIVE